ncbi:MAG: hypothetical protein ACXVH6_01665, partial [Halobacteriota archaeon]
FFWFLERFPSKFRKKYISAQPTYERTPYGMCEALKRNECALAWHSGLGYGPSPETMVKTGD